MNSLPFLAACLFTWSALAQNPAETIRQLEKRRFAAQEAADAKTLNDVLADDLVYTHSNGIQDSKRSFIESLTSKRLAYRDVVISGDTVRFYGPDLAIVTGQMNAVSVVNGQANPPMRLRYTDVYARRKGRWQMVAWQSARLAN